MDINSQHQNLLGNQISPKSEDFCILVAILDSKMATIANQRWISIRNIIIYLETIFLHLAALVTMATAAILDFFQHPKSCHTLRWIFLQSFMKFDEKNLIFFKSSFFVSMATAAKFVQPIPIFLAYLVPLDMDVVPIKCHQFLFGE
jgi:hypothetical protein